MNDNKLIDLHKVARLFREIQTEEFAKEEVKQESEFKKTIEAIDSAVDEAKAIDQEVTEELTAAQKKLPAGLRDAIAKKQGDSADDKEETEEEVEEVEENINELNVPNDLEKVKAQIQKLEQMAKDAYANGDSNKGYNIERSSEMLALQKKLTKLGGNIDEEVDEVSDTTLSDILKAAGVKVVTDADLNQAEAQPVEEGTMRGGLMKYDGQPEGEHEDAVARYKEFMSQKRPPSEETATMVQGFVFDDELLDSLGDAEEGGDVLDVRSIVQGRLEDFFGDAPFGIDIHEGNEEAVSEEAVSEDSGQEAKLKAWVDKWSKYKGGNADPLPRGWFRASLDSGITTDGIEQSELDMNWEEDHLPITDAMKQEFIDIMGDDDEETMHNAYDMAFGESVTEDPEQVSIDANTLQQILNLAGVKPVTDADINQPVEEYSNSPDEEYADTDTQLNKMSGGINRPKAMPTVGNQGHNELVMKLKKAYSDIE